MEKKNWFNQTISETEQTLETNLKTGLTYEQVKERQEKYGLNELKEQKKKSPSLARILSIIPGGGYLYTNHKGSALTAFVINSLLGYATYTSVKSKNYGVAGVCGFLGLSFYIGNINGAGRSAVRRGAALPCSRQRFSRHQQQGFSGNDGRSRR